jgi:hypothetical protein
MIFRPAIGGLLLGAILGVLLLTSCTAPSEISGAVPPGMAFLADAKEETYSEILQKKQRIVLQIELVDTVRPLQRLALDGRSGYVVPAGTRRVQFRVLLPSTGLADSRSREARGYFDVLLVGGKTYQMAGNYEGNKRTFFLRDLTKNESVTPPVDLGFFGPVRREIEYLPIIIPIKI